MTTLPRKTRFFFFFSPQYLYLDSVGELERREQEQDHEKQVSDNEIVHVPHVTSKLGAHQQP